MALVVITSLKRAQQAIEDGSLRAETAPVTVKSRKGEVVVTDDEQPGNANFEKIPTLRPAFKSDGTVTAISPGDATVEAKIPGLAAKSGFLFIKALGQVGFYVDGAINWDIATLVGAFGLTLLLSQVLSSQGMPANPQQSTANKITPVMITGMFLFFPLPAGVLLYMVVANIFQAFQTFLLNKEALPENLQKILDQQLSAKDEIITTSASTISDKRLPFEPNSKK